MAEEFCAICDTPTTQRCIGCRAAYYCSVKCQTEDWKDGHEVACANQEIAAFFGVGSWKGIVERHTQLTINLVESVHESTKADDKRVEENRKKLMAQIEEWTNKFARQADRTRLDQLLRDHIALVMQFLTSMALSQGKGTPQSEAAAKSLGTGEEFDNGYEIVEFWIDKSRAVGRWYTRDRDYKAAWDAHIACTAEYIVSEIKNSVYARTHKEYCLKVALAMGHVFNGGRWKEPEKAQTVFKF